MYLLVSSNGECYFLPLLSLCKVACSLVSLNQLSPCLPLNLVASALQPADPVAYRLEPMLDRSLKDLAPANVSALDE